MKKHKKKNNSQVIYPKIPSDPLQVYLQKVSTFPILTKLEEQKLSKLFYENKDPQIAKILAQANLRFVIKVAAEYTRFGSKLIDLIQEGNVGLLHAIKEFNPHKGVRLISYAIWWIRGYIQEYLMRQYSMVRIGTNAKQRKLFYLLLKQQKLAQLPYTENHKLLTYSGFKDKDIQSMNQRLSSRDISLDQPATVSNNNNSAPYLIDLQTTAEPSSIEDTLNLAQETTFLKKSIKKLQPKLNTKELYILKHRFLTNTPVTLQVIGNKFNITREAIRQTETRLLQKIKKQIVTLKQD